MLARMGDRGAAATSTQSRSLERCKLIEPYSLGARTLASVAGQADVTLRTTQRLIMNPYTLYMRHLL
jgi:hypothetical protein